MKLDLSTGKELDQEEQSKCENNERKCSEGEKGLARSRSLGEVSVTGVQWAMEENKGGRRG